MSIDEVKRIADVATPQGAAVLQEVLSNIHQQATGIIFTSEVPIKLDFGKLAIYDDGAGTQRLYVKTNQGNIVSVALT